MKRLSLSKEKINFVLLEGIHPCAETVLREAGYSNVQSHTGTPPAEELATTLADCHFLGIRSRTQLNADTLSSLRRLNAIGCFCIGTNQVDLDAAQDLGIPVFNAPFSNTRSVAELVLAEMILLLRQIPQRNAAAHRGQWLKTASNSHEVRGKTLGIVGYGHIGTQLGVLAEGLGMHVRYYDIEAKLPLGNAQPMVDLDSLLRCSQVLSLHVPATAATAGLIGRRELALMPNRACLINASRGNVVDIEALAESIKTHHLSGAAIDVFPAEPKSNQEPFHSALCGLDNVILTPHIGGSTQEAQENIALEVANKLIRYSDNGSTRSAVNFPQVTMPDLAERHRILHIHHNEPGVLERINKVFSGAGINIAGQFLQTSGRIGYVVTDLDIDLIPSIIDQLSSIPGTIRTRVLY